MSSTKISTDRSGIRLPYLNLMIVIICILIWLAITVRFPVFFQRDDFNFLSWSSHHSVYDCFKPDRSNALANDNMYRPFRELGWVVQYNLFGLHEHSYHVVLGLILISTLILLFKLSAYLHDEMSGYLSVLMWLAAFQFLLTNVFWFSDTPHLFEMLILLGGLNVFVRGFGRSLAKTIVGLVLVVLSFMGKEPATFIGPSVIALFVLFEAGPRLKWGSVKSTVTAALLLMLGPLYLAIFPYALHRHVTSDSSPVLQPIAERYLFYSQFLTSGITGLVLIIPAVYFIVTRLAGKRYKVETHLPIALILVAIVAAGVVVGHLPTIGVIILIVSVLMLPRRYYFLLPFLILVLPALYVFGGMYRTYLYELSFGVSILFAAQLRLMLCDIIQWWKRYVPNRWVTAVVLGVVFVLGCTVIAAMGKERTDLLGRRSEMLMSVKLITPKLLKLPKNATLVIVDYESMGLKQNIDGSLSESDKLKLQTPMENNENAQSWMDVNGRNDITAMSLNQYIKHQAGGDKSRVFLWLLTPRDHEFIKTKGYITREFAHVGHGPSRHDVLEIVKVPIQGRIP